MIAQIVCNDCHEETSLFGFIVRSDLKYTKLAHLLETNLKTEDDFNVWLEEKEKDGSAYYKDGDFIIDGVVIPDQFQQWEQGGCKCPECGAKNCFWF